MKWVKTYDNWITENELFEANIGSAKWTSEEYEELKTLQLQNLKELVNIFNKHKTRFWIDCGTLLGMYRDGSLIDGDSDCDVGVFSEDITPDLIESLKDRLYAPTRMFYETSQFLTYLESDEYVKTRNLKYVMYDGKKRKMYKGVDVSCDIFIYFPNSDYRMFKYGGNQQYIRTKAEYVNRLGSITFKGTKFKIPSNTEKYLEQLYGKNWKTPDPKFDYRKENPWCLIDKSDIKGEYLYNFKTHKSEIK
jgi:phosphorylcholine metabolism protein LicD